MAKDFVVAVASSVSNSLVYLIKRQFGYVISSESYAQDLQKEVGKMAYRADWVHFAVEEARNNVPDVDSHVTEWQQSADKALEEARELLGDFEKATKTCCYGTLPDPKCRYQFSRKAEGKIEVIKQLVQCRGFKELANISFSNPAPGNVPAPNPARRPNGFEYVMSSKSFADRLREEVRNLKNEDQRVNVLVERAINNVRFIHTAVVMWEESANKAMKEARELLEVFEKESKTCCYGTLPDPYRRYQFSTKAEGKIKVIQELAQQCIDQFKELNDVSIDPAPLRDYGLFESRAAIIRDIMDALADHSNSVVGIYGMGGIGKSTLLVDAEKRIREEKQFDWVAKADVSINPDFNMIRGEIAYTLGLTITSKKYVSRRADRLRRRLADAGRKEKKVLIILDNLWEGLELKSVGIPCGHDNKVIGCKLLLASRDRNVLQGEMGCDRVFRLDPLKYEEAKRLFERIVGDTVHDDEFKPSMKIALDKCAGLPLLITAMAVRLRHADLSEWKRTLDENVWSKHEGFDGLIKIVVQLSYDRLDEEAKSFLQLCVCYDGSEPSLENLVKYGIVKEEDRETSRSRIDTLKASSLLLEDGDADGFKIHDLIREFVKDKGGHGVP